MTKNNLIALAIFSTTLLGSLEGAMAATPMEKGCCKACFERKRGPLVARNVPLLTVEDRKREGQRLKDDLIKAKNDCANACRTDMTCFK